MAQSYQPIFSEPFLRAIFADRFAEFAGSAADSDLMVRLQNWTAKSFQVETAAENAFVDQFCDLYGLSDDERRMVEKG